MTRRATVVRHAKTPRLPGLTAGASTRVAWANLAELARAVAGQATGTTFAPVTADVATRDFENFRHQLRDARADEFPIVDASARHMATAFLNAGRAFALVTDPERRTSFAEALGCLAKVLDDLLVEQRTAAAQSTWGRQFREGD